MDILRAAYFSQKFEKALEEPVEIGKLDCGQCRFTPSKAYQVGLHIRLMEILLEEENGTVLSK